MSTNRRTAFARTPRNNRGTTAPAAIQVNKSFLDRFTQARLAPDMATVLTKSSAELNITVQPNGKGNFSITSSGKIIGDAADVQKVQSLGSFVNDERKAIIKTSVSSVAKRTIAAIVSVSREPAFGEYVDRPITRIDKNFVDIFRSVNAQADMLNTNVQQISQLQATGNANELVRNHLIETGARIRECLGKYLLYRAGLADGDEPRKLNDFLIEGKVISWVFTRLCSQKLQLGGKDFEYRKVYFPRDATKGMVISFHEMRNDDLVMNQGGILRGMSTFGALFGATCVRQICGIPDDWDLNTLADRAKVLRNVPIMVVPPQGMVTLEEHFSILSQHGERGMPWSVGNTNTPQDTLRFLGTVPKRIAYGFIGRARFMAAFYEGLFPGFRFDPLSAERENRSVFNQLLNQFRQGNLNTAYFSKVNFGGTRDEAIATTYPVVLAAMDIPPESNFARAVNAAISAAFAVPNGETAILSDLWGAIATRRQMTDEQCNSILSGILATSLDPKSKDNRKSGDIRMARSMLSSQGGFLVKEFKRKGYRVLGERVEHWLRSFLTTELQSSVAEVMSARLEASLSTPITFGSGDTVVYLESAEFESDGEEPADNDHPDEPQDENPDDV